MKKALCLFGAVIGGVVMLTACGASTAGVNAQSTQDPAMSVQIIQQADEKEYYSSNGKHLLGKYSYTMPAMVVTSEDPALQASAEAFNQGIHARLKTEQSNWDDAMNDAQSYYDTMGSENWNNGSAWVKEIRYESAQTDSLISLRYEYYVFSGGAHGYTYYTSQLFSVKEGRFLELRDMTDDPAVLEKTVADEILRQIDDEGRAEKFGYWNDYQDYVNMWMEDYSVYFDDAGAMEIIFPAYDLAPYVAGAQTFSIDQNVYLPCMNDYGKVLLGADLA